MKNILIVDDTQITHDSLNALFSKESNKIKITHMTSSLGALDVLSRETFDLIILDYKMPGLNGVELLKLLRKNHIQSTVAFFSADIPEDEQRKARKLGVTLFFSKPPKSISKFKETILKTCGAIQ